MAVVTGFDRQNTQERSGTQRKRSVRGRHSRTEGDGTCRFSRLARKSEGRQASARRISSTETARRSSCAFFSRRFLSSPEP